ncbi:hypothetical protein NUW58_g1816 [Xylaria curta]|uniref:Uncharacterized protein n=1 Tax=Xylaria curta TaxID=42375 RepID=A0ACC1PJW3_9PEZI|nr:hypothetical protein NUW58_g1816 [Xylaria curta]
MASFVDMNTAQQEAFLSSPVLEPLEGQVSNLVNPPNGAAGSEAVLAIAFVLSTIAVIGRVYARFILLKKRFLSDYIILLGYAFTVVLYVYDEHMARVPGLFVDLWNVSWRDAIAYIHDVFVTSLLYPLSILLIKVAILLDWLVLFVPPGSRNFVYWAAHVMIWVNVVFYLSVFIANQVACTPYEYSWNKLLDGNCDRVNTQYTNLASGIFNVISDIVILLIPQKVVWKLNMQTRMKVGVFMIFGIGLLGCIIAILRLVETVKIKQAGWKAQLPVDFEQEKNLAFIPQKSDQVVA